MTITVQHNREIYTADGVTTEFGFTFKIFKDEDLTIAYVNESTNVVTYYLLNKDYTVGSTSITMTTAPPIGGKLVVWGTYDLEQQTDYRQGQPFLTNVHENTYDKLTMLMMRNSDDIGRIPKFADGGNYTFPDPEATKLIGWNTTANGLINYVNNTLIAQQTETAAETAENLDAEAYQWANNPEDEQVVGTLGTNYSSLHWSLKSKFNADLASTNVYETVADGTTQDGMDVFHLPFNIDVTASGLSCYGNGLRYYPSDYTISGTRTVLFYDNIPVGTEMLFVTKEYESGYSVTDFCPVPTEENLTNIIRTVISGVDYTVYELGWFQDYGFEAGTKCWFFQNTAPVNWVIYNSAIDSLTAVKATVSGSYSTVGGVTDGDWNFPGSVGTASHYHAINGATLTSNQLPAHTHPITMSGTGAHTHTFSHDIKAGTGGTNGAYGNKLYGDEDTRITAVTIQTGNTHEHELVIFNAGGTSAHSHGNTSSVQSSTGGSQPTTEWRPAASVGIIATKQNITLGG